MVEILDRRRGPHRFWGDDGRDDVVAGNETLNDYGEKNLPGGEVFTAPVADSVEGEVLFDKPLYHPGREVTDLFVRFEDGQVVEHSAGKNEDLLTERAVN